MVEDSLLNKNFSVASILESGIRASKIKGCVAKLRAELILHCVCGFNCATKGQAYPTRVTCQLQGKDGQIVLDQNRTVDKTRLVKQLGQISLDEQRAVLDILAEMFTE